MNSKFSSIRKATENDIPLIRALAEVVFPATYEKLLPQGQVPFMMEWMYSEESLQRQMAEGHTYYIAYADGQPCGYLSVERQGERLFHLQKIYVLPDYQGQGVGEQLFRQAVTHVQQEGKLPATIELNVNRENRAVGFYLKMGMHRARTVDVAIGDGFYMNDYIMELTVEERAKSEEER
ncbi:MAG: GNAT family N-acetyltransferase [Rikenellaceae bacterium]|nr:GNAT family N-acetyltransferase [Rikenellaceae bacterium]